MTRGATPAEHLLRTKLPAASRLGDPRSRFQRLRNDPGLLVRGPAATPTRTSEDLYPPKRTLRVVAKVKHKDSSKPIASAKLTTSWPAVKQGRQSPAHRHDAIGSYPHDRYHVGAATLTRQCSRCEPNERHEDTSVAAGWNANVRFRELRTIARLLASTDFAEACFWQQRRW